MQGVLETEIPFLMDELPREAQLTSPAFGAAAVEAGGGDSSWAICSDKAAYDMLFDSLGPANGKLDGGTCMPTMQQSGCNMDQLRQIWELADMDHDGFLDSDEFAVAMHLCKHKLTPDTLPADLIPPARR
jgi:hypothetical protein